MIDPRAGVVAVIWDIVNTREDITGSCCLICLSSSIRGERQSKLNIARRIDLEFQSMSPLLDTSFP